MFYDTFTNALDCYAPLKKKRNRSNHNKFTTKKLRKEVMVRSRFRNKYNKIAHWSRYKKQSNIFTNILKKTKKSPKLTQIMNDCLKNNFFPDILKNDEITPCFKKGDRSEKENYRSLSILSSFSKVFERLIYEQLNEFMGRTFSRFLTGFPKNHKHNTHY